MTSVRLITRVRDYYRRAPYTSIWQERWYVKVFALAVLVTMIYLVGRYL